METVTVEELKARLDRGDELVVLDVREPDEWQLCRLPGATHIPLGELQRRLGELDPARETVVMCHHGMRSHAAAAFMQRQGFAKVANLVGGIHAWALRIDPAMRRY